MPPEAARPSVGKSMMAMYEVKKPMKTVSAAAVSGANDSITKALNMNCEPHRSPTAISNPKSMVEGFLKIIPNRQVSGG